MKKDNNLVLWYDAGDESTLNNCCGILEVGGFSLEDYSEDPEDQYSILNPQLLLKEHRINLILATTIASQKTINLKLLELGFKELERTTNPKTRNTIILWCYKKKTIARKKTVKG